MKNGIVEQLSNYSHKAWAGWMKYLFSKSKQNKNGTVTIPKWAVDRWKRQSMTVYKNLPEAEKESDQKEANEILKIFLG